MACDLYYYNPWLLKIGFDGLIIIKGWEGEV
jgi:hypothetical protein